MKCSWEKKSHRIHNNMEKMLELIMLFYWMLEFLLPLYGKWIHFVSIKYRLMHTHKHTTQFQRINMRAQRVKMNLNDLSSRNYRAHLHNKRLEPFVRAALHFVLIYLFVCVLDWSSFASFHFDVWSLNLCLCVCVCICAARVFIQIVVQ